MIFLLRLLPLDKIVGFALIVGGLQFAGVDILGIALDQLGFGSFDPFGGFGFDLFGGFDFALDWSTIAPW